jgi:predicted phosphoadenosine phosphosulfate sulfurtransferase
MNTWTRNLEYMLPGDRSYRRICASIIQYMCRLISFMDNSRTNADGLNERG